MIKCASREENTWKEYILCISWEADVRSAVVYFWCKRKTSAYFAAVGAKSFSVTLK